MQHKTHHEIGRVNGPLGERKHFLLVFKQIRFCNSLFFQLIKKLSYVEDQFFAGVNFTNQFAQCAEVPAYSNGAIDTVLFHQHFCRNFTGCYRLRLLRQAPHFGTFLQNESH
jgi:hypothetical protein